MAEVLIFGIGSSVVVDVEETLDRCGHVVVAALRNHPGESFFAGAADVLAADDAPDRLKALPIVLPLFTPAHRQAGLADARRRGFLVPFTLIDPTAVLPRKIEIGLGCYINAGCVIGAMGRFGRYAFVNRAVSIGHHFDIGDFVSIGPGAVLAAHVKIGVGATIGAGATILPKVTIGANAVVAAGSVVTVDVGAETLVAGAPAVVKRAAIGGYKGVRVA